MQAIVKITVGRGFFFGIISEFPDPPRPKAISSLDFIKYAALAIDLHKEWEKEIRADFQGTGFDVEICTVEGLENIDLDYEIILDLEHDLNCSADLDGCTCNLTERLKRFSDAIIANYAEDVLGNAFESAYNAASDVLK